MRLLLLASAGGAIGAGMRFAFGQWVAEKGWAAYPWATLVVNVTGSLLMGVAAGLITAKATTLGPELRVFLATGILGGYTTFSAFSLEAWQLAERGEIAAAVAYVASSVVLSIAALGVGLLLARLLAG
jgi:CrcB protein